MSQNQTTKPDSTPTVAPKVTRAMLEAAHRAEIEHYARAFPEGSSLSGTPYPVLKVIIEAALEAMSHEPNQT